MDIGHRPPELPQIIPAADLAGATQPEPGLGSTPLGGDSTQALDITAPDNRGDTLSSHEAPAPQGSIEGGRLLVAATTEHPIGSGDAAEGTAPPSQPPANEGDVPVAGAGGDGGNIPPIEPPVGGGEAPSPGDDPEDTGKTGDSPGTETSAGATARQEVRLPLGIANELFETAGSEVGGELRQPETVNDHRLHGIYSMAALAQVEHGAIAQGQQHTQETIAGKELITYVHGTVPEQRAEYDVTTYQGTEVPLPGMPNVTANYVERIDAETGEMEYIVKVQPQPTLDVPEGATLAETMAAMAKYEAAQQNTTEYIWESQTAHRIRVIHTQTVQGEFGQGFETTESDVQDLPIQEVVETTRLLRAVAIRAALARKDYTTLEAILPHDPEPRRR